LKDTEGLRGAFSGLGFVLGTVLQGSLVTVSTIFDGLVTTFGTLVSLLEIIQKLATGDVAGAWKKFGEIGDEWKKFGARTATNASSVIPGAKKHNDVIITKDGQVHETAADDTLIAAKNLTGGKREATSMNMPIGPFYVTVTEGDAEQAGRNFGSGLAYSFRNNVSSARLAEGM
jgi:hypothetical protein